MRNGRKTDAAGLPVYTTVHEHFETIFNAVSCRLRLFNRLLVVDVDHLCIHLKRQLAAERVIDG